MIDIKNRNKILIIAEKPDMAKKIAFALNHSKFEENGYFETDNFIFTYAIGHLYKLAYPQEMDEKYKSWNIDILPFAFTNIKLNTIANNGTIEQAKIIKKLLVSDTVGEIINACDADREGEYIFRNIILGSNIKFSDGIIFSRMWISSTTNEGIQEAFKNRRPLIEYKNLGLSAKARAYADYHLGLNATRAMTSSFKNSSKDVISVGRVQTPTLKMIVDRENDINNFKSKKLYSIKGKFKDDEIAFFADYVPEDKNEKNEYENIDEVNKIISSIEKGDYIVNDVKKTKKNISHKPLFSLSDLQIDMSSKYGYSAQIVLNTVQSLYEKYSLVTYPRTDEKHISPEWANKCNSVIVDSLLEVFNQFTELIKQNNYKIDKKCIANKDKIGAHEALTPTGKKITKEEYNSLNTYEKNVYDAIVLRFLTAFLPDAIDETTTYLLFNGTTTFKYSFTKQLEEGFRIIDKPKEEEKKSIEIFLNIGHKKVDLLEVFYKEKDTQPPKRFTEGTLIKEMKNPSKYLQNKDDQNIIKKVEGIGTEATRAGIIESLKQRNYITVDKKQIIPTQKGIDFIKIFPSEILKSVSLTVDLERKLDDIEKGKLTFADCLNYIFKLDKKLIDDIKEATKNDENKISSNSNEILCKCPFCGSNIIEKDKLYCCENKECNTVIFKNQLAKSLGLYKISSSAAKDLFMKGKTSKKVSGFTSKNKKRYSAYLTYKKENNKNDVWITFE